MEHRTRVRVRAAEPSHCRAKVSCVEEIQARFRIVLLARELLVYDVGLPEFAVPAGAPRSDFFAERQEIVPRHQIARLVCDQARAAEVIPREIAGVARGRSGWKRLCRPGYGVRWSARLARTWAARLEARRDIDRSWFECSFQKQEQVAGLDCPHTPVRSKK
jgi:hypothetical protein